MADYGSKCDFQCTNGHRKGVRRRISKHLSVRNNNNATTTKKGISVHGLYYRGGGANRQGNRQSHFLHTIQKVC